VRRRLKRTSAAKPSSVRLFCGTLKPCLRLSSAFRTVSGASKRQSGIIQVRILYMVYDANILQGPNDANPQLSSALSVFRPE